MTYYKKIIGERLYLSPMRLEDAAQYVKWLNNIEVAKGLTNIHRSLNVEAEREWLTSALKSCDTVFAIVTLDGDRIIGNTGLHYVDTINRAAEFGIFIGEKDDRGKGYGTEAARLMLDHGFNLLNLHNIFLKVYGYNLNAIRSYEKVGFKKAGVRREAKLIGGKYYDEIYMDILDSEFESPYIKKSVGE